MAMLDLSIQENKYAAITGDEFYFDSTRNNLVEDYKKLNESSSYVSRDGGSDMGARQQMNLIENALMQSNQTYERSQLQKLTVEQESASYQNLQLN